MRRLRRLDRMPSDKLFYDEGKKGMKRGQHVMARDQDYLASLKGGVKGGAIIGAGLGLGHSSLKSAVNYVQNADDTLKPGEKNNLKTYFSKNGGHNKKLLAHNVKRLAKGTGKGALIGGALGVPLGMYLANKRSKNR